VLEQFFRQVIFGLVAKRVSLGRRQLSTEEVLVEASDLQRRWPKFEKRKSAESSKASLKKITLTPDKLVLRYFWWNRRWGF